MLMTFLFSGWSAIARNATAGALAAAFALLTPTLSIANERRLVVAAVEAVAVPVTSPIVLDGKHNEEIWQQAPAIVEFLQRDPDEGRAPTQRTEARVAYDEARSTSPFAPSTATPARSSAS